MKTEEQHVAIAKAAGFHWQKWAKSDMMLVYPKTGWTPQGWTRPKEGEVIWPCQGRPIDEVAGELLAQIPFTSDLNAIHEAEKMLTVEQTNDYYGHLSKITVPDFDIGCADPFPLIHSTASKRAEAFLRTLNLWKP